MSATCVREDGTEKYIPVISVIFPTNVTEQYAIRDASFYREASAMKNARTCIDHMHVSGLAPWHLPELYVKQEVRRHG